jgi:hypothetical protein
MGCSNGANAVQAQASFSYVSSGALILTLRLLSTLTDPDRPSPSQGVISLPNPAIACALGRKIAIMMDNSNALVRPMHRDRILYIVKVSWIRIGKMRSCSSTFLVYSCQSSAIFFSFVRSRIYRRSSKFWGQKRPWECCD